jgi:hypothetical protein
LTEIAEVTTASPNDEGAGEQSRQLTSDRRNRKGSGLDSMVLAELKQLASSLGIKGIGAMRKSQLIDAIQSAQRGPGADASLDQAGQDNGHRSVRDDRDARGVASALDELQRAPREASDEREEAQMLDDPVQPELVSETQPSDSTPEQRQKPAETVDGGQVRKESGAPRRPRLALVRASVGTEIARTGRTTDGIAEAAIRVRLARTSATIRIETTRIETTRAATGKRKAAAAAVAGAAAGIARTGVTAVVAAVWNATTSR